MVLTVSFVLSPVTGLVCHRRRRRKLRQLDASVGASGPHDFAVRVSTFRQACHQRPPHPAPRPGRSRNAPLWDGTALDIELIWVKREAEYFCKGGLDG